MTSDRSINQRTESECQIVAFWVEPIIEKILLTRPHRAPLVAGMKIVLLTDQQWLMIESSSIITLKHTVKKLDEYLEFDPTWTDEMSDEMHYLAAWADLSVTQQRDALAAFRKNTWCAGRDSNP